MRKKVAQAIVLAMNLFVIVWNIYDIYRILNDTFASRK